MTTQLTKNEDVKDGSNPYHLKVVVVKFGGVSIQNEPILDALIDDTVSLIKQGVKVVLVHGGGTFVNDALAAIGKTTTKVNGLRVTDSETLEIALKTFGELNERLTEKFKQKGVCALSFCGKDSNPLVTVKMQNQQVGDQSIDLGWVGEVVDVNTPVLDSWLWSGWVPIVPPIGMDKEGKFYNVNADHAALAVASSLRADSLIFMTDVPGVLADPKDLTSKIPHLTESTANEFIEQGTISGGMLPKIKSCMAGIKSGVEQIAILNSFEPNALFKGFLAPEEVGTLITGDKAA